MKLHVYVRHYLQAAGLKDDEIDALEATLSRVDPILTNNGMHLRVDVVDGPLLPGPDDIPTADEARCVSQYVHIGGYAVCWDSCAAGDGDEPWRLYGPPDPNDDGLRPVIENYRTYRAAIAQAKARERADAKVRLARYRGKEAHDRCTENNRPGVFR